MPPGPVDNSVLLDKEGQPKPNLKSSRDYRGVCEEVWGYFMEHYGGGPALKRKRILIYQDVVIN